MRLPRWSTLRFRTKLAIAMLSLMFLTIATLFAVDTYNERRLVEKIEGTTEAVTKAIQVASDQLSTTGAIDTDVLQDYAEKLRQRGVREIQILNPQRAVIASSKGRVDHRVKGVKGSDQPISITGTIGETSDETGPKRDYRLVLPITSQGKVVGYVTVDLLLDDYDVIISQNFARRAVVVTSMFGAGLALLLILTRNFTRPVGALTLAASRVAEGDLDATVPETRRDDLGALVATWNLMLARLREQRELETRLAAAERRASLGHLASGIAHEIRNPLNTIGLAVEYLRRRFRPEEPAARDEFEATAKSLRDEIARLNDLITNFLTFGKPLRLSPSTVEIRGLIQELADGLRPEASTRGVSIDVGPGGAAEILADPGLLKSAFLNVALNAIQMMAPGGHLEISVQDSPASVRVRFDDTGPGISTENLPKVFEPYFSTRDAGVGLGLALTRKIAREHGGELTATNRSGGGSRFEFDFRRESAERRQTA
jgi:signal transduction histidine kinase